MRCTVPGSTPNCFAMTRTPGLPGVPRASRIRFSSAGANPGIPRDWDLKAPQVAQGDYYRNVLYFPRRRWGIVWWRVGNLKLDGRVGGPIYPPVGTLYGAIMKKLKERLERAHRADHHFAIVSVALMVFLIVAGCSAWMFGN